MFAMMPKENPTTLPVLVNFQLDFLPKNKIFQPFFTTRERGSGLGLAIVSRLVQDNGGRLTLDRSSPEGTCFRLSFPCVV